MADAARVRFHLGEGEEALASLSEAIALCPDDAQLAQMLARRGYLRLLAGDRAGIVADFKTADKISPLQDFRYLKLLGEHTSNQDTAYAVSIFDRALRAMPAEYPPRLAYARVFQQRGACHATLRQYSCSIDDLRMAVKLGLSDAKTFMYMSSIYLEMDDPGNALRHLNKAVMAEPGNQTLLIRRAQFYHDAQDIRAAEANFCAAEALGPLPDDTAAERQQMRAGTWQPGEQKYTYKSWQ